MINNNSLAAKLEMVEDSCMEDNRENLLNLIHLLEEADECQDKLADIVIKTFDDLEEYQAEFLVELFKLNADLRYFDLAITIFEEQEESQLSDYEVAIIQAIKEDVDVDVLFDFYYDTCDAAMFTDKVLSYEVNGSSNNSEVSESSSEELVLANKELSMKLTQAVEKLAKNLDELFLCKKELMAVKLSHDQLLKEKEQNEILLAVSERKIKGLEVFTEELKMINTGLKKNLPCEDKTDINTDASEQSKELESLKAENESQRNEIERLLNEIKTLENEKRNLTEQLIYSEPEDMNDIDSDEAVVIDVPENIFPGNDIPINDIPDIDIPVEVFEPDDFERKIQNNQDNMEEKSFINLKKDDQEEKCTLFAKLSLKHFKHKFANLPEADQKEMIIEKTMELGMSAEESVIIRSIMDSGKYSMLELYERLLRSPSMEELLAMK